jgi:hypothetical protein
MTCSYETSVDFKRTTWPTSQKTQLSNLILPSLLLLYFQSDIFPSEYPSKILYVILIYHACYMPFTFNLTYLTTLIKIMQFISVNFVFISIASSLKDRNILLSRLCMTAVHSSCPSFVYEIKVHTHTLVSLWYWRQMTDPLNEAGLTELCTRGGGFCCRKKNPEATPTSSQLTAPCGLLASLR